MAVYRIEARGAATMPRVQLIADPAYADLDLFVCMDPGTVIAASAKPGGVEGATLGVTGTEPCYVVVTAGTGASAGYELTVEEAPAAFASTAVADYSDYMAELYIRATQVEAETEMLDDPLADKLGAPEPFGGG
jgi:hypothetical protein